MKNLRMLVVASFLFSSAMASGQQAPAEPAFERVDCSAIELPEEGLGTGVECGRLRVAEAREDSRSPTLVLPVVILRAIGPEPRADPLLYLHGGPGIATLDMVPGVLDAPSWSRLRQDRDIILFDQRGTGRSFPSLCPDFDSEMNRLAREAPPGEQETAARVKAALECRVDLVADGRNPASYNSTTIAQDAEDLRRSLGYETWNLWPTSFGTLPAIELVRRYPSTIRSLILNSAFPPNSPNRAEQIGAMAEALGALQGRCNLEPACAERHPDIRSSLGRTVARLDASPLAAPEGRITGPVFLRAVWTLLVRGRTAVMVPELLRRAEAGDDSSIVKLAGPFSSPATFGSYSHAQAWLVNCHDVFPRPSEPLIRSAMAAHPDLAIDLDADGQDLVCNSIQPDHSPDTFYSQPVGDVPALIFFGEFDPATPRGDAVAAQALLPGSTLVEIAGASHAPMGTDDCTLGIATAFLDQPSKSPDTACLASREVARIADPEAFEAFLASMP